MRLLLVEDDPMIGDSVRRGLQNDGAVVDWVQDGQSAEAALLANVHDLMLLDIGLPKKSGLDVLRGLRQKRDRMPVLILTARDAVEDRVQGLDAGADDYLVKPFSLAELGARVRALLRRDAGRAEPTIRCGEVELDPASREVKLNGRQIELTAREFALLQALMQRPGTVLSREQLGEKLYGWGQDVDSNTIEVYIHFLRKKLGNELIKNVRGLGYMIPKPRQ